MSTWKMRDKATGEVKTGTGPDHRSEFMWTEGSMACDVNRAQEFFGLGTTEFEAIEASLPGPKLCRCRLGPGFSRRFELLELDGEVVADSP